MSRYETAPYEVLLKEGSFEVRAYPELVLAVVSENTLSDNDGFREIFGYISGGNHRGEKIAMTTPVINEEGAMGFVMPVAYTLEDLPAPESPRVRLQKMKHPRVASIRFSGRATPGRMKAMEGRLRVWLEEKGYTPRGRPRLLRYNPPFTPPFLRRNEVQIDILTG